MNSGRPVPTPAPAGSSSNSPANGSARERLQSYRLVVRLGYGGPMEVFLATREITPLVAEPVVVKRLPERFAESPERARRFLAETSRLRLLEHPRIVKSLQAGVIDGRFCVAEEYLEGQPLRNVLRRGSDSGGLPRELAVFVAGSALEALHYAHEASDAEGRSLGIVHGGVSPRTVFVTNDGGVKVSDFGVAGWYADGSEGRNGDACYVAPELDVDGAADRRADIWSVGAVLWEALTGKRLFADETGKSRVDLASKRTIAAPSSVRADVPPALDAIVARALAWDPQERYPDARAMQRELERWLASVYSADAPAGLGSLMRRLFANEVVEQRRLVAVLRGGDDPMPSSRSGTRLATRLPTNHGGDTSNGPPTSRSVQRTSGAPLPPPLPPLPPPPINRPSSRGADGSLPSLPPPPVNRSPSLEVTELDHVPTSTTALTLSALDAPPEQEEEPPSAEQDDRAPKSRSFDYRSLLAVACACAAFSALVTYVVIANMGARRRPRDVAESRQRSAELASPPVARETPPIPPREEPPQVPQDSPPLATPRERPEPHESPEGARSREAVPALSGTLVAPMSQGASGARTVTGAPSPRARTTPRSTPLRTTTEARPAPAPENAAAVVSDVAPAPPPTATAETIAQTGFLTLDTTPWSLVSEKGASLGQTPLVRLELPSGAHVLLLKNPELGIETSYTITILPGKTTVKRVGIE